MIATKMKTDLRIQAKATNPDAARKRP